MTEGNVIFYMIELWNVTTGSRICWTRSYEISVSPQTFTKLIGILCDRRCVVNKNKKVLLRERKRHTARRVASTCYAALSNPDLVGGYPIQTWLGVSWVPPTIQTWLGRGGTPSRPGWGYPRYPQPSRPGWAGGYPIQTWLGGTPDFVGGTPDTPPPSRPRLGVSQTWLGVPWVPPFSDLVRGDTPGTPHHPDLDGVPSSRPGMGYPPPPQPEMGYPLDLGQGTPQTWDRVPPYLDLRWGTPYPDLRWGTPSPPRPGMGYPPKWWTKWKHYLPSSFGCGQ